MGTTRPLLTFEEFERSEDEWPGKTELLDGEIVHLPPATIKQSDIAHALFLRLYRDLEALQPTSSQFAFGGVWIGKTGFLLGHNPGCWLMPAASVTWRDQRVGDYWEGAPMIVFEILSEANHAAYIALKVKKYLECGAHEIWVLYPETRHATIYAASGERREDAAFRSKLLPGIEIPFAEFFSGRHN